MRKLFATLILLLSAISFPSVTKAADYCSADVYLRDFADGFKTNVEAFDYCFSRIKWWKLDQSDGWKGRYCTLESYKYNGYTYFSMLFYHKDKSYQNAQYTDSIFYSISSDYAGRVGKGWNANIEIQFKGKCDSYYD